MNIKTEIEKWFPNIVGKDFKIINTEGDYNCVAYTLNITNGWMWTNTELWPYKIIPRNSGLIGFKKLYELYGYEICDNDIFEEGYQKIAFYAKNNKPKHAAKQFNNVWRSKLGPSVIIEHKLDWISGDTEDAYGDVVFIMKKFI